MRRPREHTVAAISALAAGAGLGIALGAERLGGLVPCALCLLERWPYRIAIVLSLAACFLPAALARMTLALVVLVMLAGAGLGALHVGVEQGFWPSPLPECAAPRITGGSIAARLAAMPARPSKPCDAPTFLISHVPLSMAAMNLIYSLVFAVVLGTALQGKFGRTASERSR
jgi:disulfide bond formation protein DsbB